MTTAVIEFIFGFHLTVSFSRKSLRVNASSIQNTVDVEHPFWQMRSVSVFGDGLDGYPTCDFKVLFEPFPIRHVRKR